MTAPKILFSFCLSFIIGVFIGSFPISPNFYLLGFLFFLLLAILVFFSKRYLLATIICFCFVFVILGIWRYRAYGFNLQNTQLKNYNSQEVFLLGKILTEPDIRLNNVQITVDAQKIAIGDKISPISGKVLISVDKYPEYNYADELVIKGTLKTPEILDTFNYQDYLAKKGIFSQMSWPKIQIARKESYSNFWQFSYGKILNFKNKIRNNIDQNFPFLQAKLLSGILLGDQSSLPQDFKDKLNITGVRHITAISGMNISIICAVLMSLFLGLGLWRSQAFYLTLIFIFLFVLMIGFQASVVRAGIMGAAYLLAQKFGRLPNSVRIIVITATIMVLLNPMILRWDVGFQLSFLAILGIVLINGPLENLLKFIPQEQFVNLRTMVATTLSAQVFTLPILIFNFGRVSLVSPITNILIVPVVDLIMIFGFIFTILNVIYAGLGWIFIWPCWLLMAYSLKVIDIFSAGWMQKTFQNLSWFWFWLMYFVIIIFTAWLKRKMKPQFLGY